tara:strand:+ start:2089 stop:3270 length:1182 start_codon:yes stop_codon:yes gene_type:complete
MSTVNNGPQIVRNGLILDLDAGNGKSYSTNRFQSLGSGTVTENVTFAINGTGTFQRVASGTVIGGYTVRPNDVVYSYALGVLGCHYHGNSAPIPAGSYATFSFDYLVTGATTYPIADLLATFEGVASGATATANSLQNVWQRRSFTSAIISTSGNMNMYLYPGACGGQRLADSGTIYYRNPKVEITNVDTGNSTFSSTSNIGLWYDLSGNGRNGTLNGPTSNVSNKGNILFNGSSDYVTGIGSSIVPTSTAPYTVSVWCYRNTNSGYKELLAQWTNANSGNSFFFGFDSSAVRFTDNWNPITVAGAGNTNVWMNLVGVYTVSNAYIYLNGVLAATKGSGFTYTGTGPLIIGRQGELNGEYFDGRISNVLIYNRALTASEISQNYEATKTRFGL